MNDADQQYLTELRAKLRRIEGNKELSPKQAKAAHALAREIVKLNGTDVEAVFKIFDKDIVSRELKKLGCSDAGDFSKLYFE